MNNSLLFPGSFDPFTLGHADLVERALSLFSDVIIAIGHNEQKPGWLPVEERVRALREYYSGEPRIRVISYSSLTIQVAQELHVGAILRGVRNTADFLYEHDIAQTNRQLSGIETILLFTKPELAHLSSSMLRELARFGQDVIPFLPKGLCYEGF